MLTVVKQAAKVAHIEAEVALRRTNEQKRVLEVELGEFEVKAWDEPLFEKGYAVFEATQ